MARKTMNPAELELARNRELWSIEEFSQITGLGVVEVRRRLREDPTFADAVSVRWCGHTKIVAAKWREYLSKVKNI